MKKGLTVPPNVKTALVTGGDSGIGFAFAKKLAGCGIAVVIVSNRRAQLEQAVETLGRDYNAVVYPVFQDLSLPRAAQKVFDFCSEKNIQVDLLINNAGVFFFDEFIHVDINKIRVMLDVHVSCVVELCRLFGRDMAGRKNGFILNMSSMATWIPLPGIQMYSATKSLLFTLSSALFYELKKHHVGVTVMTPGAIGTAFFGLPDKQLKLGERLGVIMPVDRFADIALKKTFAYKKKSTPGWINHLFLFLVRMLPDWLVFKLMPKFPQLNRHDLENST